MQWSNATLITKYTALIKHINLLYILEGCLYIYYSFFLIKLNTSIYEIRFKFTLFYHICLNGAHITNIIYILVVQPCIYYEYFDPLESKLGLELAKNITKHTCYLFKRRTSYIKIHKIQWPFWILYLWCFYQRLFFFAIARGIYLFFFCVVGVIKQYIFICSRVSHSASSK